MQHYYYFLLTPTAVKSKPTKAEHPRKFLVVHNFYKLWGTRTYIQHLQRLILSLHQKPWQTCTVDSLLTHTNPVMIQLGSQMNAKFTFPQKLQESGDYSDDCKRMSCLQFMTTHQLTTELNLYSSMLPILHPFCLFPFKQSWQQLLFIPQILQQRLLFLPHHTYSAVLSPVLTVARISAQVFLKPPFYSISELDTDHLPCFSSFFKASHWFPIFWHLIII